MKHYKQHKKVHRFGPVIIRHIEYVPKKAVGFRQVERPNNLRILRAFYYFTFDLLFLVSTLGAYSVFIQSDTAQRATVFGAFRLVFLGRSVNSAGESQLDDIQFVL